jgi:hypothetical protein
MSAQSRKATKVDTKLATTSNDAAWKEPGYSSATGHGGCRHSHLAGQLGDLLGPLL